MRSDKKVTIVHKHDRFLLSSVNPDKYRKRLEKDPTSLGVNIISNGHVDNFESTSAITKRGETDL